MTEPSALRLTVRPVAPTDSQPTGWRLSGWGGTEPCLVGWGAVAAAKREGDGVTPAGVWPLRRVLFRPDRLARPASGLAVAPLDPADGWCDDPGHPAYNRPVRLPFAGRHEAMWRTDGLYDLVVVLGHNDDPVVPGAGSAVFLHVADPAGRPTAGCVAVRLEVLLAVLAAAGSGTVLDIGAAG